MVRQGWRDWYAPREIYFTHNTALWLINNLGTLREGHWPAEETSYTDIPGILKKGGTKAPFVTPVEFAAEITRRLENCTDGHIPDGLILLALECWGESEAALAKYFRIPEWSIRKRARRALAYVASGPAARWQDTPKRKGETYQQFKMRRKREAKLHK